MEYVLSYGDGIFEVRTAGEGCTPDFAGIIESIIMHPEWHSGGRVFIDHSYINFASLSADDVRDVSIICARYRRELGHGKCAILVSGDVEFGKTRMWESTIEGNWDMQVKVSRDREILFSWLKN
jgi:hypothetical protein